MNLFILGTILPYNLCVASFSMKLGHMSGQMLKRSLVFSIIFVCETSEIEVSLSFFYMLRLIREKTGLN